MASRPIARTTVAAAVEDWLEFGLSGRSEKTVRPAESSAEKHIIPDLGARKLHQLTAEDVDQWLKGKSSDLARSTLQRLLSILRRALTRQVARDRLRRNVALHCEVPHGRAGRPSKALSLDQATAVLEAVEGTEMEAYVTVSLLTGARTEELRALTWSHLDLEGVADADPPRPPSIQVWRSVREGGDTKTRMSRRTLRLPDRAVDSLRRHLDAQNAWRSEITDAWSGARSRLLHPRGPPAGPRQCAAILPCVVEQGRTRRPGVDASGAAPQLRLTHVRRRRAVGGHLAPRRAPQHDRDRVRLPQAATPSTDPRDRGDGPTLPAARQIF